MSRFTFTLRIPRIPRTPLTLQQFDKSPNFPTLNYLKTFSKNILKKLLPFQKIVVLLHDIL